MSEQYGTARPGKRAKKRNALKHGVYSREIMLPGEQIRDYESLGAELNEEWVPEGRTELSLVDRLVGLYWRKQRLDRYENAKLKARRGDPRKERGKSPQAKSEKPGSGVQ